MQRPRLLITRRLPEAVHERLREQLRRHGQRGRRCHSIARHWRAPCVNSMRWCRRSPTASTPTCCSAAPFRTRVIANFGAGIEHIDLEAARRANIVVTNTPGALTEATAEIALLLMLMAARRAGEGERLLRAGQWSRLGADPTTRPGPARQNARADRIRPHRPRNRAPRARLARRARGLSFTLAGVG